MNRKNSSRIGLHGEMLGSRTHDERLLLVACCPEEKLWRRRQAQRIRSIHVEVPRGLTVVVAPVWRTDGLSVHEQKSQ